MTVRELREQGYIIKFNHQRRYVPISPSVLMSIGEANWAAKHPQEHLEQRPEMGYALSPNGGKTVCTIQRADGEIVAVGETTVNEIDRYDKRLGRAKALGRAIAEFVKPPEVAETQ